jgi:hypothetical protein
MFNVSVFPGRGLSPVRGTDPRRLRSWRNGRWTFRDRIDGYHPVACPKHPSEGDRMYIGAGTILVILVIALLIWLL